MTAVTGLPAAAVLIGAPAGNSRAPARAVRAGGRDRPLEHRRLRADSVFVPGTDHWNTLLKGASA